MADKYGSYYNNGSYDVFRAAIRYEVTSTSETAYTIRCRSWIQTGEFHDDGSNFQGRAYITNSYSSWVPGSGYLNAGDESGWLGDITKTITRTHSAQTITCSGQGWSSYFDAYTPWVNATVTVPAKASYKVTYNANGGSGAPSAQTKWYGEALTLSSTKPTRAGYTFGGWNTKSDGSGTNYSAGGSYTGNAAVTLYAKWTAITYTVAYNANSGSGTMASQTKTYGTALALRTNAFTRTGYDFVRFNTKSDGSGTNYPSGGSYSANAAATMYAQWSIKSYSVKYNANKPSAATGTVGNLPSSQTKTYGATLKLSTAVPTLSGYTFKGWATTSTATTAAYSAGGNYTANAAATLYAVWQVAAPSLTIVSAYRADSSGDHADEGTYASVTVSATSQTGAALSFSVTVGGVTVTSPTASAAPTYTFLLADACPSQDDAYAVSVTVTDANGSATRTTVIQTAWYAIDIRRGGHGIAFGKVASTDNLADFGMGVHVGGDLSVDGSYGLAAADIPSLPASKITSGTLAIARGGTGAATANANVVFAGPSSGSAAAPSFRALAAADIPGLAASKIASGTFDAARIPSLAASKIASGTLAAARIPSLSGEGKLGWVSLGSVTSNAAETNKLTLSLTGYEELLILCRSGTTYNASALVKASWLSSTSRDYYLGGWYRTATYASAIALTSTSATPYQAYVNGSAVNATWYLYAR